MISFKKILAGTLSAAMVLGTMAIPAFADENTSESSTVENNAAKIGDTYYDTVDNAINAAQDNSTIEILTSEAEFPKNLPALNNVTIKGAEGKTTVKTLAEIDSHSTNLTFENIEFSQTTNTLKIQGTNVTFNNCDFNAKTLKYSDVENTALKNDWYTDITSINNAKNITFDGCTFNGDDAGEAGFLPNARMIVPYVTNLTIKNCDFSNAWAAIPPAYVSGNWIIDNSTFNSYCYTIGCQGDSGLETLKVTNSILNGWTSYSSAKDANAFFENCSFGRCESGFHALVGYKPTTFTNCTFTEDFHVLAGKEDMNPQVWNINNCKRNGVSIKNGNEFFAINGDKMDSDETDKADYWKTLTLNFAVSEVNESAKSTGITVTLNNLAAHDSIELTDNSKYAVVIDTADESDIKSANTAIENNVNDTNNSKQIYDISILKTDSNGVVTDVSKDITAQKVTLTLSETPEENSVKVYHVNNVDNVGNVEIIENVVQNGNKVTFTAPSFSTYAVTYTTAAADPNTITSKVNVAFTKVDNTENQYYITLKALDDNKNINRFMSADLAFLKEGTGVDYEITPAANINANVVKEDGASREYHFEMNGSVASSATGSEITLGTITFNGFGTVKLSVDKDYTSEHSVNIVNTAKASDNIVDNYTVAAGTLVVNDVNNGVIDTEITPETADLTVNVSFPNAVKNNVADYQDMKVTVSGNGVNEVVKLGNDVTFADNTYTVEFNDTLVKNNAYTVTVSGAGYRTARYTVSMSGDKTLNFWNNVKDTPTFVEEGVGTAVNSNFLAGDIVKDGQINIYDLSAVVSYFGTDNLVAAHPGYAKYDLNRDGVIDSKDVAYVLVSWGK